MDEFLAYVNGQDGQVRMGLTATMDGAWQKRSSGNNYNSRTGHNFAIGGFSGLIIAVAVFSKHCRMCEVAKKRNKQPKAHRCSKNFPMESAKSMEGIGTVEHCKSTFSRQGPKTRAYIRQIVTDDDSTTRANLRHSIKAVLDDNYGDGGWQKKDHWPRVDNVPDKPYVKDNGLMPLWVPQVLLYLCDISHRVKVIVCAMTSRKAKTQGHLQQLLSQRRSHGKTVPQRNKSTDPETTCRSMTVRRSRY